MLGKAPFRGAAAFVIAGRWPGPTVAATQLWTGGRGHPNLDSRTQRCKLRPGSARLSKRQASHLGR